MSARSSHTFAHFYDAPAPFLTGSARAPPQSELGLRAAATFSWGTWWPIRQGACRTFKGANPCGIESDMWTLARALVAPHHAVLELGGRYGTTSCVLAEVTNNSGKVVSVEPDPKAQTPYVPISAHTRVASACSAAQSVRETRCFPRRTRSAESGHMTCRHVKPRPRREVARASPHLHG